MKNVMVLVFSFVLLFSLAGLNAQSFDDYLGDILDEGYGEDYIKGYTQPLSTALGTSLGSALYHRGYTKSLPRFDVGISVAYVQIPDDDKSFGSDATGQDEPTFFGSTDGIISGINQDFFPRFLRRYHNLHDEMIRSFHSYINDVKSNDFPNDREQY